MSQKLDHAQVATKLAELRTEEMANHVSDGPFLYAVLLSHYVVGISIRDFRNHEFQEPFEIFRKT